MDKELARYFVKLIAEDLHFSFNGMGIPSYSCEWLENQLIQGNFDKVEEFIKTRYDERNTNVTLEIFQQMQKTQELENETKEKAIKTRKFRAMTIGEYCRNINYCNKCEYRHGIFCDYSEFQGVDRERERDKSYKTKDGKYILIEVKE